MIQFSEFLRQVKAIAIPERIGANVEDAFRSYVVNGLIRTQSYIPCLKDKNVDFYVKAETQTFCNTDIINGPRGVVEAVYAFKPSLECRKYFYDPVSSGKMNCWVESQRCQCDETDPPSEQIYDSPYCNLLLDGQEVCAEPYVAMPEDDDAFISGCEERIYSKGPDDKLYLAPRFPCGYVLAVHSSGIKRSYRDTDAIMDDDDLKHAVASYAESRLAEKDRDIVSSRELMNSYNEIIRDMAYRCREEMRTPQTRDCAELAGNLLPFINPLGTDTYIQNQQDNSAPCVYCP